MTDPRRRAVWLAVGLCALYPSRALSQAAVPTLTVFAATDLTPAFRQLIPRFEEAMHAKVVLVPGSTGILAEQIRNGAPADVFFAASDATVDDSLVLQGSRTVYARGSLVLLALKGSPLPLNSVKDLADSRVRRIAIANPAHAPYGLAAQQALQSAGIWAALQPRLVYGENVQQALQFVQSGSVDAGIVARSLADHPDFRWQMVDRSLYTPLNQTAVVLARSRQPRLATSFIEFVRGDGGRAVMRQFGFLIPGEDF